MDATTLLIFSLLAGFVLCALFKPRDRKEDRGELMFKDYDER